MAKVKRKMHFFHLFLCALVVVSLVNGSATVPFITHRKRAHLAQCKHLGIWLYPYLRKASPHHSTPAHENHAICMWDHVAKDGMGRQGAIVSS